MQKKKFRSSGNIKCDSCGNYHYRWWMILQRVGCASYLQLHPAGYQIVSTYGSGYDTLLFKVIKNDISYPKHISAIERLINKLQTGIDPVICDKCMKRFIKRQYIVQI